MDKHNPSDMPQTPTSSRPPMPEYRIGDFARYMGVTPDFLKHYEQFRLVTSNQKENGYRYYPFHQSYKLLECMRLRNYGLPLKDIDYTLIDEDADAAIARMNRQVADIERHILFEQALVAEHKQLDSWYSQMKDKGTDWFVREGEAMLFLPHTSQRNFLKDSRIYEILPDWLACMPMVKSCMRMPLSGENNQQDFAWGLAAPESFAKQFHLPLNDAVLRLPPRKMFFFHFAREGGSTPHPASPQRDGILDKLAQMGLTPQGDIYMTMLMYTHINDAPGYYGYYAVPID